MLQDTREDLGWTLVDIASALRIRPEYLAALERDDISDMPGSAYAMGFLKSYADYLGLDGPKVVSLFRRHQAGVDEPPELNFPMPLTERGIPGGNLIIISVLVLVIGYGTWSWFAAQPQRSVAAVQPVPAKMLAVAPPSLDPPTVSPDSAMAAEPPVATILPDAPPVGGAASDVLSVRPKPEAPISGAPVPPGPQIAAVVATIPAPAPSGHVYGNQTTGSVVVKATADSWCEVLDDGHSIWSGLLKAGDVYNPPKDGLLLRTGSAGAIQISVNGKTLPVFGQLGEVKKIPLDSAKLSGG
jgi:cytoskeleton protein RodZ